MPISFIGEFRTVADGQLIGTKDYINPSCFPSTVRPEVEIVNGKRVLAVARHKEYTAYEYPNKLKVIVPFYSKIQ